MSIALVVVFGILVFTLAGRFGKDPRLIDSALIGKPAPTTALPYLEREGSLSLGELRGEIVVVNFWASWCLGCRAEHPALMTSAARYRNDGVRFVGVVYQDSPGAAIAFLDELGRGYDSVVDDGSRLAIDFGVFGVPETYFIDREGIVAAKITGASNVVVLSTTLDQMIRGEDPMSKTVGTVQPAP